MHPGQRKHSINKLYFLVQTRASNNLEGAWLILVPGQWESTWSLAELFQLFLLGRMGTASSFPGGFFFLQKNLSFHAAFTLHLFPAGYKEQEVRMLHHHRLAPLGGGSVFPSRCNFSLLPLYSPVFFTKRALSAFTISWVISCSINEAYNCVFLTAPH